MPEQTATCPICAFSAESERAIHAHVLTSHRKSAITDVLLKQESAQPAH